MPWTVAWVLLTAAGTALHWGAWIAPALDPPVATFLSEGIFKHIGNFMTLAAAPGWIIETAVAFKLFKFGMWQTGHSVVGAAIANGLGWVFCLTIVWALVRVWRRLRGANCRHPGDRGLRSQMGESVAARVEPPEQSPNLSRRRFVVNAAFGGAALGGSGTLVHASTIAPWELTVARYRVPIRDLPASLDGLRIVQVTDTHLGPRVPAEHVRSAMRLALSLKPDVLALTGDYVHNGFYKIAPAAALFAEFFPLSIPVVGVLGNHDWYAGGKAMSEALTQIGVRMVDNGRVFLDAATRSLQEVPTAECLCIAGLGDLQQDKGFDVGAALDGVPLGVPRVVLAHNPDTAECAELLSLWPDGKPRRIDLMLSGHTHGGQVSLPLIGPPIVPSIHGRKYARGLVQGPLCPVVVSAGVGLSLVPVRFNVPPEVVEITLARS
jgi:uncharacterized protein